MGAARLSEDDRLEILRLYGRGVCTRMISDQFSVAQSYPGQLAKRRGHAMRWPATIRDHMSASARARRS
jgi:hypothetical protein